MFCRSCGATLEQGASFCTHCGAQIEPVSVPVARSAPDQPGHGRSHIWLVFGALGLLSLIRICAGYIDDDKKTTPATNLSSSGGLSETPPASTNRHKIGDDVFVGYWSYRCVSAHWQKSIGSEYTREYPDAVFLVVDLVILNNAKTASILAPVKLVDTENREYDESSKDIFLDNSFGILKSVNPGVASRGYLAFDVPRGRYALKVSGGFTSGKSELIDLQ